MSSDHGTGTGHVVHPMVLVGTLGALLVLTFFTVAVTWVDFGPAAFHIAMAIATLKAALVVLFFMHLYWDKPIIAITFITSLVLVALFISLSINDTQNWMPEMIPDYAPRIERTTAGG